MRQLVRGGCARPCGRGGCGAGVRDHVAVGAWVCGYVRPWDSGCGGSVRPCDVLCAGGCGAV
eukprot:1178951-Prorocentrum_minimum.AAC.5